MNNVKEFLNLYREYESMLRDDDLDYKQVEDTSDDLKQNRMRINRQIRNYLSHQNDPEFLSISNKQLDFLRSLIESQKLYGSLLKDHITTYKTGYCTLDDTIDTVINKMSRLKINELPVINDKRELLGMIRLIDIAVACNKNKRIKTVKGVNRIVKAENVYSANERVDKIPEEVLRNCVVVCMAEDKTGKKFMGIYRKS